jgi:hypothetical protein
MSDETSDDRKKERKDVRTVYLGEFTHEHADEIARRLEAAGILWWAKVPGVFTQIWERSVRVFVDRERLVEAEAIAAQVLGQADGASGHS